MKKSIVIHLFLCIIASVYLPIIHIADQYAVHEYQFTYLYFIKIIAAIVFGGMFCMDQQCSVRSLGDLFYLCAASLLASLNGICYMRFRLTIYYFASYLGGSDDDKPKKKG